MTYSNRSRALVVATALVLFLEGGTVLEVEAFVLPSGLASQRNLLPGTIDTDPQQSQQHKSVMLPLRSFKFIKGETSYGDLSEGSVHSGMLGGPSAVGFGGSSGLGGNTLSRNRRGRSNQRSWWSTKTGFSRNTPTTLLAAGSLESWPVMEADDIQVLVRKGEDLEDDFAFSYDQNTSTSSSVRATLERWERDISLEVVGNDGYSMLGNEQQPNGYNNNGYGGESQNESSDRCTQSIKFDVANGDVYPFSGTISVPPPLTVEDSMGNQQTVMMVLNNPDENDAGEQYDDYGNAIQAPKPSSVEAQLEPLFKSPDQKYAEAQKLQQQQQPQYDEWGNEIYDPQQDQQQQYGEQTTTIPSQGYQSFELDANDPATGKIKISLEREDNGGGGGFGGAFGGRGGSGETASEARIEIHHGFRDQYGNSFNNEYSEYSENANEGEEDRRISLEVSTMHPTFSSVVDTMPANLLAKHALPSVRDHELSSVQPYLEVRIVNTGGAALKAGVQSFLPQYRPQNKKEQEKQYFERQQYERRQQLLSQPTSKFGQQQQQFGLGLGPSSRIKADDPFLLTDSAQSSTSSRRMNNASMNSQFGQQEKSYVRASSRNAGRSTMGGNSNGFGPSINQMWSTGSPNTDQTRMPRPAQEPYYGGAGFAEIGIQADNPLLRDRFVQAEAATTMVRPRIQSRVSPEYYDSDYNPNSEYNAGYNSNSVYGGRDGYGGAYDAIDTIATPKGSTARSIGLVANNDFTKADGSGSSSINRNTQSSAMVPGSMNSRNFRRFSPDAKGALPSFGGNSGSGSTSGMQQPFQGRSKSQYQSQSFGDSNGGFANGNGNANTSGIQRLQQTFQDRSQSQSQSFEGNGASPQRTQTVRGPGPGNGRSSSAFGGNGKVIGNGVISGRSSSGASSLSSGSGYGNRMPNNSNNDFVGGSGRGSRNEFSPSSNSNANTRNNFNSNSNSNYDNNEFGGRQQTSSSFQSSYTPPASENFGGGSNRGGFGEGTFDSNQNLMQQLDGDEQFSRDFGNNNNLINNNNQQQQRNGGRMNNAFGRNNNNINNNDNQQQRLGGRIKNAFSGNKNNNSGQQKQQNGGRIKNPFGGNKNNNNGQQQQQNGGRMNNSFGGNNNNGQQQSGGRMNNSFGGNNNNGQQQQQNGGRIKNPFGGNNNNNNDQQQQQNGGRMNNSFGGNNNNGQQQQQNGGRIKNPFGGNKNNNNGQQQQQNGGRMNNSFGGNNNNSSSNNSGPFGRGNNNDQSNSGGGKPFGNLGKPPQTRGNSKNPFAKINGEATPTAQTNFSNKNSNFGGNRGGGAPLPTTAKKNPFAGLNRNSNNGRGTGGSTTAMRSSNRDYRTDESSSSSSNENPIMGFAKNIVKGIGDYGNR